MFMTKLDRWISNNKEREITERRYEKLMREDLGLGSLISYVGNKKIPILRLYRYKEAFAYDFVSRMIYYFGLRENDFVFDPFAGMGTALYCSMIKGIPSIGVDKLPLAKFIAETIPKFHFIGSGELKTKFKKIERGIDTVKPAEIADDVRIINLAFNEKNLRLLRCWKTIINELDEPYKAIFLLLFFSILEECSYTSKDGQFLRLRRDKEVKDPTEALRDKVIEAENDITKIHTMKNKIPEDLVPMVHLGDTRDLSDIQFPKNPTAIITSPPYLNRYDYSRSYSLELCFHFVKNFEGLKKIRFSILRSHIESKVGKEENHTHPAIKEVLGNLSRKKLNNPKIPSMITAYFIDMEKSIKEWSKIMANQSKVALVVDNVRFEGETIPVDLLLSDIAGKYGFETKEIIIARYKGNSSQQMKKYGRVPVRESVVVWKLKK